MVVQSAISRRSSLTRRFLLSIIEFGGEIAFLSPIVVWEPGGQSQVVPLSEAVASDGLEAVHSC